MPDFIPRRDEEFAGFAANFAAKAAQTHVQLHLTPQEVAALLAAQQVWADAWSRCIDPAVATRAVVHEKRAARAALEVGHIRPIAHRARRLPSVSDAQLIVMGLRPRPSRRKHVPAPAMPPELQILSTSGRCVTARLSSAESPTLRGRPRDVERALVYHCVGSAPAEDIRGWKLCKSTTRTRFTVDFPPELPIGTMVWVMARWANYRCEPGPCSHPAATCITFAGPDMRQSVLPPRIAA